MNNDNADFIAQISDLSDQMERELRGIERAIAKSDHWVAQAEIARTCLLQVNQVRNELFSVMAEIAGPPQLPNYNQVPEYGQEIELEDVGDMPRLMSHVHAAVERLKRGQAA